MPITKHSARALRIELEVTPAWWHRLGGKQLGGRELEEARKSADVIARSMLLATGAFETCEVRVSRSALKLIVMGTDDITLAVLAEKAGQLRDRMNALVSN